MKMNQLEICRYLDHAVLRPDLSREEAIEAIKMGIEYRVKTVCVRPCDIALAVDLCQGTETEVSCVLAFPHGHAITEIKALEAKAYCDLGVNEIDMVANYGFIKSGMWDNVLDDIKAVVEVAHQSDIAVKVIVESSMLTLDEVAKATEICIEAGADFIKTSTGFNGGGATEEVIKVMLEHADGKIKVKPSGGIRNKETAEKYIAMGCHRLGNNYSSTPAICDGKESVTDGGIY